MTKQIIASICVLGLLGMAVGVVVQADVTGTVAATVTVQNISVAVTDGTVTYGVLAVNTSTSTVDVGDTQTATNNGNDTQDLNIKGQDSTSWTLGGSAGSDVYVHEFSTTSFAGGAGSPLTISYQTLATGVTAGTGTQVFDLKITTPTVSSSFSEQSVDVTVQAIAG